MAKQKWYDSVYKKMHFFATLFEFGQFAKWIWGLSFAGAWVIFGAIKWVGSNMPLASLIAFSIAGFVLLLLVLGAIIPRILSRSGSTPRTKDMVQVPFYQELQNEDVLKRELKSEVKQKAWVAWQTGYHFRQLLNDNDISDKDKVKIERIILIHPDCVNIPPAISHTANFAQDIRNTTREAINKGIEVRWVMTLPTNIVIRDPRNEEASIRIEAYMVNIPTHQWPNFIITKKYQQGLFSKIITAYTKLWEDKEQRYIPQPEDYQER